MKKIKILWTDDEIDLLKPHILFLNDKGYEVVTASNGDDAVSQVDKQTFDLMFLDEHMPGLSGLETLNIIKSRHPSLPVIMITKSEEENIMDAALGSKIADYLIKPVNPNQILLSIKKNMDTKRLITRETTSAYQSEFSKISMQINSARSFNDWEDIYRKLVYWELELGESDDSSMLEVLQMQKNNANSEFGKFIKSNYIAWFNAGNTSRPLLSPNVLSNKVFPLVDQGEKVIIVLIDNLRLDQWKTLLPTLTDYFIVENEDLYCSILPTATQYARNALFAGLMPKEIDNINPDLWLNDDEEGGKNQKEEELLQKHLIRVGKKYRMHYEKILNSKYSKKVVDNFSKLLNYDLVVLVYNFVDMLSHANTEMEMIRELAGNDAAYRSLTLSWFQHSYLLDLVKLLADKNVKLIITTDHGSIRVNNPVKVIGDKKTSTNLRYKTGKNLNYDPKEVFDIKDPADAHLPRLNVSSRYIFAADTDFFAYPNNYNYYVNYYRNTFQHGGVSMEEMIVPLITLRPK